MPESRPNLYLLRAADIARVRVGVAVALSERVPLPTHLRKLNQAISYPFLRNDKYNSMTMKPIDSFG